MARLQVRLLVLIALGTISRCQDPGESLPDGAAVVASSGSAPLGCGPPKPSNVRLNKIKVEGPDSDVVYQRMTLSWVHIYFALNNSTVLPADNLAECAKAAATAGLGAFRFDGRCIGYQLILHFLKCQTGDRVIFVRTDYLDEKPTMAPIDEAPFKVVNIKRTMYMLSGVVEADDDHPSFTRREGLDYRVPNFSYKDLVYFENGDVLYVDFPFMDLNFCLNDGAYGLQLEVTTLFGPRSTTLYFFEECGRTVQISSDVKLGTRLVYSHHGFGCQDYPSGLPDECTVTFEGEDSVRLQYAYGFFFPETDSDDGGLIMTITAKDIENGVSDTQNIYQKNSFESERSGVKVVEVSILRQPSKRALCFLINVNPV